MVEPTALVKFEPNEAEMSKELRHTVAREALTIVFGARARSSGRPFVQACVDTLWRRRRIRAAAPPPMPIRNMVDGSGTALIPIPRVDVTCKLVKFGNVPANI